MNKIKCFLGLHNWKTIKKTVIRWDGASIRMSARLGHYNSKTISFKEKCECCGKIRKWDHTE